MQRKAEAGSSSRADPAIPHGGGEALHPAAWDASESHCGLDLSEERIYADSAAGFMQDPEAWLGQKIDDAVKSAESSVDSFRKDVVSLGKEHGGVVGEAVGKGLSDAVGLNEGALLAVYDMGAGVTKVASGLAHLANPADWLMNPKENLDRLKTASAAAETLGRLTSPVDWALRPSENLQSAAKLVDGVTEGYQEAAKDGDWSKFGGRLAVDVGSFFIGAGEASAAVKGAEGAEGANAAAHLAQGAKAATKLADGANAATKLADGANAAAKLADGANAAAKLADGANAAAKVADGASAARKAADGANAAGKSLAGCTEASDVAAHAGEASGDAGRAAGSTAAKHPHPTGAGLVDTINPDAEAAYDVIRASRGDVSKVAKTLGVPESVIQQVKDHLFVEEHSLTTVMGEPNVRSRFVAIQDYADLWHEAEAGTISAERAQYLKDIVAHENVEAALSKRGLNIFEPVDPTTGMRPFRGRSAHDIAGVAERNFMPDLFAKIPKELLQQHLRAIVEATLEVRGKFRLEELARMPAEVQKVVAQIARERG